MYKLLSFDRFLYFLLLFLSLALIGLVFVSLAMASQFEAEATGTTSSSCKPRVQLGTKLDNLADFRTSPLLSIPANRRQRIPFLQSIDDSTPLLLGGGSKVNLRGGDSGDVSSESIAASKSGLCCPVSFVVEPADWGVPWEG